MAKPDFFISYVAVDTAWASWIAWVLEENGFSVVLQAWDFVPGSNFVIEMHRASTETPRTLLILSEDYLASEFAASEWAAAFARDPNGMQRLLIPIRVRKCVLEGLLKSVVYLDLVDVSESEASERLLNALTGRRIKPIRKPNFPGHRRPEFFPGDYMEYVAEPNHHSLSSPTSPWRYPGEGSLGRILYVEDQHETRDVVGQYLSNENYLVIGAADGIEMRQVMRSSKIDLVILDLMLPGEDGLTLARELRSRSSVVGIIILTGRSEAVDRIIGLEMGADDYLPKPFHLRELLARVRSVIRRIQMGDAAKPVRGLHTRAHFSGWSLDLSTRGLTSPSGTDVRLTTGEFDLLAAFVDNANQVLSRDQLLDLAHNRAAGPFDRTIDAQVARLRRKLEENPQKPAMIQTVRGAGYIFSASVGKEG